MKAVAALADMLPGWVWALLLALCLAVTLIQRHQLGTVRADLRKADRAVGTLTSERDDAREAATICSDGVEDLLDQAARRAAAAAPVLDRARQGALQHQQRAQQILSTPAAVPDDDAASARARIAAWLQGRGQ